LKPFQSFLRFNTEKSTPLSIITNYRSDKWVVSALRPQHTLYKTQSAYQDYYFTCFKASAEPATEIAGVTKYF
jgi:hypothetical protein